MATKIPNEVRYDNGIAYVTVTRRNGDKHTIILDEDTYRYGILKMNLHVHETRHKSGKFYGALYDDGKLYLLHRYIHEGFLWQEYNEVDHVNPHETLNCTRRNLRPATRQMQMNNTRKHYDRQQQQDNQCNH